MIRRRLFLPALAVLLAPAGAWAQNAGVTLIVPAQTGGAGDAIGRLVASLLTRELNRPVTVRNRPEGEGVAGHEALAAAAPDGNTIGLVNTELAMMHWRGATALTHDGVTPLALLNRDPMAVFIRAESRIDDLRELFVAIRGKGRNLRASGSRDGGLANLALAGLLQSIAVPPDGVSWVASAGAAPAMEALLADRVDFVIASVPDAAALLNAGLVRGLAVMDAERNPGFPDIPTLAEAAESDWTASIWRGIAAPPGLPEAERDRLVAALRAVFDSPEFDAFMNQRGFAMRWAGPQDFAALMAEADADMGRALRGVGLMTGGTGQ